LKLQPLEGLTDVSLQGVTFELCTGVAADHLYEYPLLGAWNPKKKPGKSFVIYDAQENKFCGKYFTSMFFCNRCSRAVMIRLFHDIGQQEV
jgi:hypothetical protein